MCYNLFDYGRSIVKKLIIAGILVVVVGGGVLGYTLLRARSPQGYFDAGKKYYDQKKYSEATISLLNAVRKGPRNRDARFYLAKSYEGQQEFGRAITQLRSLLELYPDDVEANLELGRIYLMAGRTNSSFFKQAQDQAKKVLDKDPKNQAALILSGNAAAGLQDFDTSVEVLEKAAELDPKSSTALISLGATQVQQKNLPEAEKAFLKAREANPKDKAVLISLANFYRAANQMDKAEEVFKDALAQFPADRAVYLQASDFYFRAKRIEDAEKVLRNAQAGNADDPTPTLGLATYYDVLNRRADAIKVLQEGKQKFPKSVPLLIQLANNLVQDKPEEAKKEIDEVIKNDPKNPTGYVLLGQVQFAAGQFDAAEATLSKEPAVSAKIPQAQYVLGNLSTRKGKLDEAQDHYQKSLAINQGFMPARMALAEVLVSKGRFQDSRQEVKKILEAQPGNVQAHLLKGQLDTIDKNYTEAEKEFGMLIKQFPNDPGMQRQMALFNDTRGKTADAEKGFQRVLELAPKSEQAFRDLTGFYMKAKQPEKAVQKLNSVPDSEKQAFHYELLGSIAAQGGKYPDAEKFFKKAQEKDSNRPGTDLLLFNVYVSSKRMDEALAKLDEMAKKNPSNAGLNALRGNVYQLQGKSKEAQDAYAKALQGDANNDFAANNLAYLMAEDGKDLQTALGYAQAARKHQPNDPNVADTLGWIYYKLGNFVLAREQAQFAVSKIPESGLFEYHLGMIHKGTNDNNQAETALKKAIASKEDFKEKKLADAALQDIYHWRHLVK